MGKAGLVAVAFAGALCSAASAQEAGRYQMERNDSGGYVRLDTLTGEMAFCTEQSGRIACGEMSGEGEALADKVARLEARIEALERKVGEGGKQVSGLPTDEEFERTLGFMEKFFRRFIGIAKEFEDKPQPEKT